MEDITNNAAEEEILDAQSLEEDVMAEAEAVEFDTVIQALRKELEEIRLEAENNLDGWQRSLAEFSNYKKRIEREQKQVYQTAVGNVLLKYLEIVDDLERALKNRPAEGDGAKWAGGIELIYRKLLTILENEGVSTIQAESDTFDPTIHEAISLEESDQHESGEVIEVVKQGYKLGERVLRPATVRVAK